MSEHNCRRCEKPMRHDTALVCSSCSNMLRRYLQDVAKVAGDITLTVARLDNVARGAGSAEDLGWWKTGDALEAISMPVDLERAARHDAAVGELTTWVRLIAEHRGELRRVWEGRTDRGPALMHPLRQATVWLVDNLEWLRHQPFADEAWPSLLAASGELLRVVDTARDVGDIVGLCSCGTARHATDTKCKRCGALELEHDRGALDAATGAAVVTASEAARWVADMGLVTDTGKLRKLIWAWADRGHIAAVDDVPRYRFGDVLSRVMDSPALLRAA